MREIQVNDPGARGVSSTEERNPGPSPNPDPSRTRDPTGIGTGTGILADPGPKFLSRRPGRPRLRRSPVRYSGALPPNRGIPATGAERKKKKGWGGGSYRFRA